MKLEGGCIAKGSPRSAKMSTRRTQETGTTKKEGMLFRISKISQNRVDFVQTHCSRNEPGMSFRISKTCGTLN